MAAGRMIAEHGQTRTNTLESALRHAREGVALVDVVAQTGDPTFYIGRIGPIGPI